MKFLLSTVFIVLPQLVHNQGVIISPTLKSSKNSKEINKFKQRNFYLSQAVYLINSRLSL
jgi:hypothetical protein